MLLRSSPRLIPALFVLAVMTSCESLNRAAKPKAAASSTFLAHAGSLRALPDRSPFLGNWTNPDRSVQSAAQRKTKIFIAPVTLAFLRPISKSDSRLESSNVSQKAAARQLAQFMQNEFRAAFQTSPQARYRPVANASADALQLELALVELNPNSISAGVVRTAVNVVAVPGVDSLLGRPLKSNLAIEGTLRASPGGESVFEFADNEESKSAFLLSFRDFTTYGQARQAIREWARQFEELTRTPSSHRVKDSAAFVFLPW